MKLGNRIYGLFLILLIACNDPELPTPFDPPLCTENFTPKTFDRQLIGFYPNYRYNSLPPNSIDWDQLTRIIYTFAIPEADGTIDFSAISNTSALVNQAHNAGVEVWFSLGGGGSGSDSFPSAINLKSKRTKMIEDILTFLGNNCMDGVDVDYEQFIGTGVESNLTIFVQELAEALHTYGYKISIDVYGADWFGKRFGDEIVDAVDYFHIMAYDFSGPWAPNDPGPHSSFEQAIGSGSSSSSSGIAYWENYRGWNKEKLILGVPFYGRDFDDSGNALTYAQILDIDPAASAVSQWNNIYYNGFDLIDSKAQHIVANGYQGMMIWEIGQDSTDPNYSLLKRLGGILNP